MREILLIVLALAALGFALRQRAVTWRTLRRLDEMLAQAMDGTFTAQQFDESQLSAIETRFAQYLSASAISARRVQEEKEAVKALTGDISHQVRTPLANIRLYTQLLAEQPLNAQGRTCVNALDAQAEKLQALLEALVKTSRLETGVLALHPVPTPLSPVISRAAEQYRPKAEARQITLTAEPTDGLTAVFDAKWTEEALCNLLDNAVKYTPPGGHITVRAVPYELFVRVDVTDTGCGIPEEEQAKIFGRFYRCAAAAQTQGVGIGLYLTRQILSRQGGYIKVSSREGQGSTFSMFLPREAPTPKCDESVISPTAP